MVVVGSDEWREVWREWGGREREREEGGERTRIGGGS